MKKSLFALPFLLCSIALGAHAQTSIPFAFENGGVADANEVNANFNHIESSLDAMRLEACSLPLEGFEPVTITYIANQPALGDSVNINGESYIYVRGLSVTSDGDVRVSAPAKMDTELSSLDYATYPIPSIFCPNTEIDGYPAQVLLKKDSTIQAHYSTNKVNVTAQLSEEGIIRVRLADRLVVFNFVNEEFVEWSGAADEYDLGNIIIPSELPQPKLADTIDSFADYIAFEEI